MKQLWLIVILNIIVATIVAQDVQYSQFYNDPLYINPALAGAGKVNRAGLHFRDQWPGINETYKTYSAFIDRFSPKINSGFGVFVVQDVAGSGALTFSSLALNYSYLIILDRYATIRFGAKAEMSNRAVDFSKLLFADQVIRNSAPNTIEEFESNQVNYLNSGFGLEWSYSKWNLRIGAAVDHLNEPNQSFNSVVNKVPRLYSVYLLRNFILGSNRNRDETYFKAGFYYKSQLKWDQYEFGTNFHHKSIDLGLWYRGLPVLKSYKPGYSNNEAIIAYVGCQFANFHIGYNFDVTFSRLIVRNTSGAHEVTLVFGFSDPKSRKRHKMVPCSDLLGNKLR